MKILDYIKENILYLDGGMGTLLQARGLQAGELPERWNITHSETIVEIHRAYFDAGSNVVNTNTFGANSLKFDSKRIQGAKLQGGGKWRKKIKTQQKLIAGIMSKR